MIVRWTGETRAPDVSLSTCGKRHARDRDRRRPGERVAPRSGRGTRGGSRLDRTTTYRAWREGCVWFSGACAGEWRARAERRLEVPDPNEGRRRNVCRHTPKANPAQARACRENSGVIRPSASEMGNQENHLPRKPGLRVADWRRRRWKTAFFIRIEDGRSWAEVPKGVSKRRGMFVISTRPSIQVFGLVPERDAVLTE